MYKFLLIFVLLIGASFAQTVTPNLSLTEPVHAASNWDTPVNGNFSILDSVFGISTCSIAGWNATTKSLSCYSASGSISLGTGLSLSTAGSGLINGVAFANGSETVQQAMTATNGGQSSVPAGYGGGDIPLGTQINSLTIPRSSSQIDNTVNVDNRFGSVNFSFFNPNTEGQGNFANAFGVIGNYTKVTAGVPSNQFLFATQQNLYDGGSNYTGNKTNWSSAVFYQNGWTQGQHIASGAQCYGYGSGDCLAASYAAVSWGGTNAPLDEGVELGDVNISMGTVAAVTTVASGGTVGSTSVTLAAFSSPNGNGTQGSGRYLIDTTTASTTGLVTTIAGSGPLTYTFSGITLATDTITTDSTAISAPGVATITTVGATTGITANTTLVCISDTAEFECVIPTAVGANSLTAAFRKPHSSGATLSWGGNAGKLIELNIDRWTTTGSIGFVNVLNTLRQAWPIVGCPTTATCTVWNSIAGLYQSYSGRATVSAGSNAYTMYSGTEIVSVQSGGTISNTLTLAPNNVTFGADAVEIPLYPGHKVGFANIQVNRFFPSGPGAATGSGINYNGILNDSDRGWVIANNTAASLYTSGGGQMTPPLAGFREEGIWRYGLWFNVAPTTAAILVQCPAAGCSNGVFTPILAASATGGGGDFWKYDSGNKFFRFTSNNQAHNFDFGATGAFKSDLYATTTNCSAAGTAASPSLVACAAAPSGAFSCDPAATGATCVISTTAVTTNSDIVLTSTTSANARLSVTCNTTADAPTGPRIASISNGVSFTINLGTVTTNPACFFYSITN